MSLLLYSYMSALQQSSHYNSYIGSRMSAIVRNELLYKLFSLLTAILKHISDSTATIRKSRFIFGKQNVANASSMNRRGEKFEGPAVITETKTIAFIFCLSRGNVSAVCDSVGCAQNVACLKPNIAHSQDEARFAPSSL